MIWPVDKQFRISAPWDEPRGSGVNAHVHGGVDIATPVGIRIVAPEAGVAIHHALFRTTPQKRYGSFSLPSLGFATFYPFSNYFYEIYGMIIVLISDERMHVFAHCSPENLILQCRVADHGALFSTSERPATIAKGGFIGYTANEGASTGPHLHYEIHDGRSWNRHEKRPNPEALEWE